MDFQTFMLGLGETIGMTVISTFLAYIVGLPLGVLLNITSKTGIKPNRYINISLGILVNILRSIPCLLLIIILIPLNSSIFGRATGRWFTMIIPLFFASFAYVARVVEQSLSEVDYGEVEAAKSMGASSFQIIVKVMLRESVPSLILGGAVTMVTLLGYTSFAFDFGAGGLISQAYSVYRSNSVNYLQKPEIWIILVLIVVVVQVIQEIGLVSAKKIDKRKKIK